MIQDKKAKLTPPRLITAMQREKKDKVRADVLAAIQEAAISGSVCPGPTEIARNCGINDSTVYKHIKEMVSDGTITAVSQGDGLSYRIGEHETKPRRVHVSVTKGQDRPNQDIDTRPQQFAALLELFNERFGPWRVFDDVKLKRGSPRMVIPFTVRSAGVVSYG